MDVVVDAPVGQLVELLRCVDLTGRVIGRGEDEHPEAVAEFGVGALQVGYAQAGHRAGSCGVFTLGVRS
jgi:hypothetical protein